MAEFLIKNKPATGGESDFQLDDIVMVAEDGAQWGGRELDPARFRIISIPGPRSGFVKYIEPDPATLRDAYPRSMIMVKRFHTAMAREVRNSGIIRKQRRYYVDGSNNLKQKLESV